jgi:Carboxypeptidase regulatory-like domain
MTARQEQKLNMYDSVDNYNNQNEKYVEGVPALKRGFASLKLVKAAINSTEQQYRIATKGNKDGKDESKATICEFAHMVSGALLAWAAEKKDTVLVGKVKISLSELQQMRDEKLTSVCEWYLGLAKDHAAQLGDYGLNKEVLGALETAIVSYKSAVPSIRNGQALRKACRLKFTQLFKEADDILEFTIDPLLLPFKKTNRAYWDAYRANRKIVNSATHPTAIGVVVKDAQTDMPIVGAGVVIEALKFEGITDKVGQVVAKPVPVGNYLLVVQKEGYGTQTVGEVRALLGRKNKVEVLLKQAV